MQGGSSCDWVAWNDPGLFCIKRSSLESLPNDIPNYKFRI